MWNLILSFSAKENCDWFFFVKFIRHKSHQSISWFSCLYSWILVILVLWLLEYRRESLVNSAIFRVSKYSKTSFIKMLKGFGKGHDPWKIPTVIIQLDYSWFLTLISKDLCWRKDSIVFIISSWMSIYKSLLNSPWYQMRSNALGMSKNIAAVCLLLLRFTLSWSITFTSWSILV